MKLIRELHRLGLMGINQRNADYTLRCNPRRLYNLVDDKIVTKQLCEEAGIPTPKLLAIARHHYELKGLGEQISQLPSFALKPARGAMGNGILVVLGRDRDVFLRPGGRTMRLPQILHHASSIVSGLYSLSGRIDAAMVEEKLNVHPEMAAISSDGVPDIRVILYQGVPVMAMTRLPTHQSDGRANLHQGAVGAGVDLDTGCISHAVVRDRSIRKHPDTGELLLGRPIPFFDSVLEIAVAAGDRTGLGYIGADVVVDANHGPMILELNARPGLAVQLANRAGLIPRLEGVDKLPVGRPAAERVAFGRELAREAKGFS